MPKSISQSQADALAEGFLNNLGEANFKPVKTSSKLIQLAGELVQEATDNLNNADRVATGALSDSIKVLDPVMDKNGIRVDITMLYYWKFIDQGVKGVVSGSPSSPYSFKYISPAGKMHAALKKWLRKEGLKKRATGQGKPISKREKKRKVIKKDEIDSAAWAIGTFIKKNGLKRTLFFNKAVKTIGDKAKEELGKSFALDIIESIPKTV